MTQGIHDPEGEMMRLRAMLRQGFLTNPDGTKTDLPSEVAEQMLKNIDAASGPAPTDAEDGLEYDTFGL